MMQQSRLLLRHSSTSATHEELQWLHEVVSCKLGFWDRRRTVDFGGCFLLCLTPWGDNASEVPSDSLSKQSLRMPIWDTTWLRSFLSTFYSRIVDLDLATLTSLRTNQARHAQNHEAMVIISWIALTAERLKKPYNRKPYTSRNSCHDSIESGVPKTIQRCKWIIWDWEMIWRWSLYLAMEPISA